MIQVATRNIKKPEDFEKKLIQLFNKVDYDNMNFGELEVKSDGKGFETASGSKVQDIINLLQKAIDDLKASNESYVQENLQSKVQEILTSGGQEASSLIKLLGGESDTERVSTDSDINSEEINDSNY